LLEKSTLKEQIGAGVILTGGMTKLKGIRELAQSVFTSLPVRIAKPRELEGLFGELRNPSYATVVGLLLYKAGEYTQYEINFNQEMLHSKTFTRTDNNLEDIKLEHTQQEPQTETLLSEEEKSEVETTVIFDDLPNSNAQKNNPVERFFNWTKQLF
ncbi:MAG: cell division protein FtsA, partial [Sulfurovum sp.]|nr:cell division protein FtsA [Sulfurovum sp.]